QGPRSSLRRLHSPGSYLPGPPSCPHHQFYNFRSANWCCILFFSFPPLPILPQVTNLVSWAWWHTPVVPVNLEAEAGRSLEPTSSRLACWPKQANKIVTRPSSISGH
uniref:Uncharacterized protein n=1 Tax=Marmota marmota marmota TaxID=9994 RepID=A0A8C6AC95_MARMA